MRIPSSFAAGAALVLCSLSACKTQQGSVEQRPATKLAEPARDLDKDNAPAVLTPEIAQRQVAAVMQHPEPFLAVRSPNRAVSLRAPVGKPVSFDLAVPGL